VTGALAAFVAYGRWRLVPLPERRSGKVNERPYRAIVSQASGARH